MSERLPAHKRSVTRGLEWTFSAAEERRLVGRATERPVRGELWTYTSGWDTTISRRRMLSAPQVFGVGADIGLWPLLGRQLLLA